MSSLRRVSVTSYDFLAPFALEKELRYEEMTDEELRQALRLAERNHKILTLENDVFERYLKRHDPQCLLTMNQAFEAAQDAQKVTSQLVPMSSTLTLTGTSVALSTARVKQILSPSASSNQTITGSRYASAGLPFSKFYRITLSHRVEMANKEIEQMKKELAELKQVTVKQKVSLRTQMEEIEMRIQDTHEARLQFEQQVVQKGIDLRTGKIPAEIFFRFMDEWLKASESIIEKLRLKRSTIESQIQKAKIQLRQSKELGASLDAIDFQQLAIENQDYVKEIEEKNQHLLDLKRITGHYSIAVTNYKEKSSNQGAMLASITKDIAAKQSQIDKLHMDNERTQLEVKKAEKQLAHIMQLLEKYTIPDILDLVKNQAELREMKKTSNRLERHARNQMAALEKFKKWQHQMK